jgi:hypothetical protein
MKASHPLLPTLLLLPLAACGGKGSNDPMLVDAAPRPDAEEQPRICNAPADFGNATVLGQGAYDVRTAEGATGRMEYYGELNTDTDDLYLILFPGAGVFAGGLEPGTYAIAGAELSWATCGLCAFVFTDWDGDSYGDQDFFATGGSITFDTFAPNLTGTVSGLTFVEATIDSDTFDTVPVPDGCTTSITSASFDIAVQVIEPQAVTDGIRVPLRGAKLPRRR